MTSLLLLLGLQRPCEERVDVAAGAGFLRDGQRFDVRPPAHAPRQGRVKLRVRITWAELYNATWWLIEYRDRL